MMSTQIAAFGSEEWPVGRLDRSVGAGWSLSESSARLRSLCPGAHGPRYEGFWVVTNRDDAEWVAEDWATFASLPPLSTLDAGQPAQTVTEALDARLAVAFRSLIDDHPAPVDVEAWMMSARDVAARLINGIVGRGECDFTGDFVRPYLGATLFDLMPGVPPEEIEWLAATSARATGADHPGEVQDWAWAELTSWIDGFRATRADRRRRGDGVSRLPLPRVTAGGEAVGALQLLVLGWLETLGDALSQLMHQLCRHPLVLRQLREHPSLVPAAVDQLLRIDAATMSAARIVTRDVEIGGHRLMRGDRVLACLTSADHDVAHRLSVGEGLKDSASQPPVGGLVTSVLDAHRCVWPLLARMTLQIALEAIVSRVVDVHIEPEVETSYGSAFRRAVFSMPVVVS